MPPTTDTSLICRRYHEVFGARPAPSFRDYVQHGAGTPAALLGYRRASEAALFLEAYLDRPVEDHLTQAFGRNVARAEVVEIGNFAADNAIAMIQLWGAAANDLAGVSEIAVATLTAPLRRMFARIGVPLIELCLARPERLGAEAAHWGRYYQNDPRVCAGSIREGQGAIAAFLARRDRKAAA